MQQINTTGLARGVILTGALSTLGSAAGIVIAIKRKSGFGYGFGYFFLGGLIGYGIGATILALTPITKDDGNITPIFPNNNAQIGNNNSNKKLRILQVTNPNNDNWATVRVFLNEDVENNTDYNGYNNIISSVVDLDFNINQSKTLKASDGTYFLFYNNGEVTLTDNLSNMVSEVKL
jgi:hypothetical protein